MIQFTFYILALGKSRSQQFHEMLTFIQCVAWINTGHQSYNELINE